MIQFSGQKQLQTSSGNQLMDISFEIQKGDFLTLYGVSGAGKTTLLRMLAGLTKPEKGEISIDNNIWFSSSKKIDIPIQERSIGFVFQDFALFPNLTVRQNLAYGLPKNEDDSIIDELLEIIELKQLSNNKPQTLSGGQKQRVALARAIVRQPKILLLDEPLSALDNEMRIHLQDFLLEIHKKYDLTTIMVTHNLSEIFKLSNKMIHIKNGKIEQIGSPFEVFNLKNSNKNFEIHGEIIYITAINNEITLNVLVHNQIKKINLPNNQFNTYKIGDKIMITLPEMKISLM